MNETYKGKFITFEGIDGCGKSTQAQMLYDYLKSKGIDVILTREPGGTEVGEKIRDILVTSNISSISKVFLIMVARYEHIDKIITPALKEGKWVICDRYIESTAAYQGVKDPDNYWDSLDISDIYDLHDQYISIDPDITFFLDVKPEQALERIVKRKTNNKYDNKPIEFYQEVYKNYIFLTKIFLTVATNDKKRIKTIDGNRTIEKVHKNIVQEYIKFIYDNMPDYTPLDNGLGCISWD